MSVAKIPLVYLNTLHQVPALAAGLPHLNPCPPASAFVCCLSSQRASLTNLSRSAYLLRHEFKSNYSHSNPIYGFIQQPSWSWELYWFTTLLGDYIYIQEGAGVLTMRQISSQNAYDCTNSGFNHQNPTFNSAALFPYLRNKLIELQKYQPKSSQHYIDQMWSPPSPLLSGHRGAAVRERVIRMCLENRVKQLNSRDSSSSKRTTVSELILNIILNSNPKGSINGDLATLTIDQRSLARLMPSAIHPEQLVRMGLVDGVCAQPSNILCRLYPESKALPIASEPHFLEVKRTVAVLASPFLLGLLLIKATIKWSIIFYVWMKGNNPKDNDSKDNNQEGNSNSAKTI